MPEELRKAIETLNGLASDVQETRTLTETKLGVAEANERFDKIAIDVRSANDTLNKIVAREEQRKAEEAEYNTRMEALAAENKDLFTRSDKLQATIDALQARGGGLPGNIDPAKRAEGIKALQAFAQRGRDDSDVQAWMERADNAAIERRALSEGKLPEGGVLVEPTVDAEILKNLVDDNPVMQVSRITQLTGTNTLKIKRQKSKPTAYWVGESEEPTKSNSLYETIEIEAHMMGAETVASIVLLQDVSYIESEMTQDAAEAMDLLLGKAFVNGDGVGKPEGILQNSGIVFTAGVDTTNHELQPDDFYTLQAGNDATTTGLKAGYRAGAVYAFSSAILGKVLKMKDQNDNYIWQANFQQGQPPVVAGKRYVNFEEMATDGTLNNKVLLLGDFMKGYRIVMRMETFLLRDPYTAKPDVEFTWYKRVGGRVVRPEAIKGIKCG